MTIAEVVRVKPRSTKGLGLDFIVQEVEYHRRHGEATHAQYTAALGVAWAVNSGRLPTEADRAIRALSAYQQCKLLDQVALECAVMADVPRWLIRRFCGGEVIA